MSDPNVPAAPGSVPSLVKRTLVEEGTRFQGTLTSSCPILVQGSVEGHVEGPSLTVSATGAVSGTITAGDLKSAGRISGELDVDTAEVAGTVGNDTVLRAASLDLKLAVESGKLQLTFGAARSSGPSARDR